MQLLGCGYKGNYPRNLMCAAVLLKAAPCPLSCTRYLPTVCLMQSKGECAGDGLPVGDTQLAGQSYADDTVGASGTPLGLQRIIDVMKCFGDTWGCLANVKKSHVMLVGPDAARAGARGVRFRWGNHELAIVDKTKYLGLWLTKDWTWPCHVAEARRKGMLAFRKWTPVLASPRLTVNVKLRVIHSNIRPILEYGMEVWGSADQSALSSLLQPLNDVIDKACEVACGVRAFADERAWERRRATYLPVLRAACDFMPMDAVCDVAHLRYDHKLHAAATARAAAAPDGPQRQAHRTRATAYAHMSLAHEWHARVASWPALRGATLQDVQAGTLNKRLRDEVLEVVSKKRCVVAAAAPSAAAVSSRGRARKRDREAQHLNPMCDSLAPTATYPEFLKCSDAVAYPILSLRSVQLPFAHHGSFQTSAGMAYVSMLHAAPSWA